MEVRFTRAIRSSARSRPSQCLYSAQQSQPPRHQGDRQRSHRLHTSTRQQEAAKQEWPQAIPLGGYYDLLLTSPYQHQPKTLPTTPAPVPAPSSGKRKLTLEEKAALEAQRAETAARLGKLFSPLTGPEKDARRRKEIEAQSRMVAGVMVPPKPEEPDNCCMSGCVNCVWDAYGDEVEAWSSAKREAREAISKLSGDEKSEAEGKLGIKPTTAAAPAVNAAAGAVDASMSMDDDGGGSQMVDLPDDPLKDVPVGIREFMKQEKKLKERKINAEEGR